MENRDFTDERKNILIKNIQITKNDNGTFEELNQALLEVDSRYGTPYTEEWNWQLFVRWKAGNSEEKVNEVYKNVYSEDARYGKIFEQNIDYLKLYKNILDEISQVLQADNLATAHYDFAGLESRLAPLKEQLDFVSWRQLFDKETLTAEDHAKLAILIMYSEDPKLIEEILNTAKLKGKRKDLEPIHGMLQALTMAAIYESSKSPDDYKKLKQSGKLDQMMQKATIFGHFACLENFQDVSVQLINGQYEIKYTTVNYSPRDEPRYVNKKIVIAKPSLGFNADERLKDVALSLLKPQGMGANLGVDTGKFLCDQGFSFVTGSIPGLGAAKSLAELFVNQVEHGETLSNYNTAENILQQGGIADLFLLHAVPVIQGSNSTVMLYPNMNPTDNNTNTAIQNYNDNVFKNPEYRDLYEALKKAGHGEPLTMDDVLYNPEKMNSIKEILLDEVPNARSITDKPYVSQGE